MDYLCDNYHQKLNEAESFLAVASCSFFKLYPIGDIKYLRPLLFTINCNDKKF